jgi:8-oxo-dGTP pyrophosphatase MutT (NUDIX family)
MGLRGAKARFMPNRLVFPGGRVDPGDTQLPALREPSDITRTHLQKSATHALARALPRTAIRELTEETGLEFGNPPDLSALDYLCRAVTPPDLPIRFNARFLIAPADAATGTLGGSGELEGLQWFRIEDALALDLARITRNVLEELVIWCDLPAEIRAAPRHTPWYRTNGGTRSRLWE